MNKLLKKKPSEEEGATKEIGVAANDLFNRVQEYAELEFEGWLHVCSLQVYFNRIEQGLYLNCDVWRK